MIARRVVGCHLSQETRVRGAEIACHVIGCHFPKEPSVQSELNNDDAASIICQAPPMCVLSYCLRAAGW